MNLMGVKQKLIEKILMTLIIMILAEYKKKISECNKIDSVNPLYLMIKDMKGQF